MAEVVTTLIILFDVGELSITSLDFSYNVKFTKIVGVIRNYILSVVPNALVYIYPHMGPAAVIEADSDGCFEVEIEEARIISMSIPESSFYEQKFVVPPMPAGQTELDYTDIDNPPDDFQQRFNIPNIRYL